MRQRALDYLGKREYSYVELAHKLKPFAREQLEDDFEIDDEAIDDKIKAILDDFKSRGWLSDARFAEQVSHARQRKFGSKRIAQELKQKGVSDDLVAEAIGKVKDNDLTNAKTIWQKKYNNAPTDRNEWAKQARFLQSRGFDFDIIKQVLAQQKD